MTLTKAKPHPFPMFSSARSSPGEQYSASRSLLGSESSLHTNHAHIDEDTHRWLESFAPQTLDFSLGPSSDGLLRSRSTSPSTFQYGQQHDGESHNYGHAWSMDHQAFPGLDYPQHSHLQQPILCSEGAQWQQSTPPHPLHQGVQYWHGDHTGHSDTADSGGAGCRMQSGQMISFSQGPYSGAAPNDAYNINLQHQQHMSRRGQSHGNSTELRFNAVNGAANILAPLTTSSPLDVSPQNHLYSRYKRRHNRGHKKNKSATTGWYSYSNDLKADLVDILHLHTGLLKESILKRCREVITDELRDAILTRDKAKIDWARSVIYPHDVTQYQNKLVEQDWMRGMTMDESIYVVQRLADASGKDPEHVRNFMLRMHFPAKKAEKVLHDRSGAVARRYVKEEGLDKFNEKKAKRGGKYLPSKAIEIWPWMINYAEADKKMIIRKLGMANRRSKGECFDLLKQPQVDGMMSRRIIGANAEEMKEILYELGVLHY
ncbi:hypothetical protein CBS101457_000139 [Exobasidium rhododendri]|nr:hypothetical protein CBS101457_000139 [Exobasidium rhododendri]